MRPKYRFVVLLIAAVLLRGPLTAYAHPMVTGQLGDAAITADGDVCPDHEPASQPPAGDQHGSSVCQIACDLGAAPALAQQAQSVTNKASIRSIALLHRLILTDAAAPDHPPPIL